MELSVSDYWLFSFRLLVARLLISSVSSSRSVSSLESEMYPCIINIFNVYLRRVLFINCPPNDMLIYYRCKSSHQDVKC